MFEVFGNQQQNRNLGNQQSMQNAYQPPDNRTVGERIAARIELLESRIKEYNGQIVKLRETQEALRYGKFLEMNGRELMETLGLA